MKLASHKCTSLRLVGEIAPALAAVANAAPREFHSYFEARLGVLGLGVLAFCGAVFWGCCFHSGGMLLDFAFLWRLGENVP